MIIGGSGSRKTNTLLNLIKEQDNGDIIDKIYSYAKDLSDPKYEFLIKKRENAVTNHLNYLNAFIECSNTMDVVYENIDDCSSSRKRKVLIVFDDMIADIMSNKNFQAIINQLFIRCRKLNISFAFITQSYFSIPKDVRLNSMDYLIMKINSKRELQNITINHSADIDYKDFLKICRERTKESFYFLTVDTTLPASNPLRFRKDFLASYKNDELMNLKFSTTKLKKIKLSIIWVEKQLKHLLWLLKIFWKYLTGEDLGHKLSELEKTSLSILHWIKFLRKGWIKMIKKKGF